MDRNIKDNTYIDILVLGDFNECYEDYALGYSMNGEYEEFLSCCDEDRSSISEEDFISKSCEDISDYKIVREFIIRSIEDEHMTNHGLNKSLNEILTIKNTCCYQNENIPIDQKIGSFIKYEPSKYLLENGIVDKNTLYLYFFWHGDTTILFAEIKKNK